MILVSLLMSWIPEIPFHVHIQKIMYNNRNTELDIIAELLRKTVCSDAMRRVLPNLILSHITSSPRGRGKVSLLVLCRSVLCRLLF